MDWFFKGLGDGIKLCALAILWLVAVLGPLILAFIVSPLFLGIYVILIMMIGDN